MVYLMAIYTPENPYKFPERIMPIFLNGLMSDRQFRSPAEYMLEYECALAGDFVTNGFLPEEVEAAVVRNGINVAGFPAENSVTDLFWVEGESLVRIKELATRAVESCYGDELNSVGGTLWTVGFEMGDQQSALAGLVYAREQGILREIPELADGMSPLYVVRDSFSGGMFAELFPEEPPTSSDPV